MSKSQTKVNQYALDINRAAKTEAQTEKQALSDAHHAKELVNGDRAGQKYVADEAASEYLLEGTKSVIERSVVYRRAFTNMVQLQADMLNQSKILTQKSKDYAGQMGEALARIDKVLVKDFEAKLLLLERYVVASKELVELEKSGSLARVAQAFK